MKQPPHSARERWNEKYSRGDNFDCRDPRDIVVKAAARARPGRALDLACGHGRNARYLAEQGWHVTAVDISHIALDGLSHPRIATVQADLEAGEFTIVPVSFDLIVDTFYLDRALFPGVQGGLRDGGLFAAEIPMEDPDAPPMNPQYLLKPGELAQCFADWSIEFAEESRAAEHQRMTAKLIARKCTANL